MKPSVNVNVRWCFCSAPSPLGPHEPDCKGDSLPLHVICPLPEEAVFQLKLGRCSCPNGLDRASFGQGPHPEGCPARLVRMRCKVAGKSWGASSIVEVRPEDGEFRPELLGKALELARERWALVRALMANLGPPPGGSLALAKRVTALFIQRNEIFASLTRMARVEAAHHEQSVELFEALKAADPEREHVEGPASYALAWASPGSEEGNSSAGLRSYLHLLLEQVEVMPS